MTNKHAPLALAAAAIFAFVEPHSALGANSGQSSATVGVMLSGYPGTASIRCQNLDLKIRAGGKNTTIRNAFGQSTGRCQAIATVPSGPVIFSISPGLVEDTDPTNRGFGLKIARAHPVVKYITPNGSNNVLFIYQP